MTSYYKTFHKNLSPLSKFRYPKKLTSLMTDEERKEIKWEDYRIETITYKSENCPKEFPLTIDFTNYIGDRSEIKDRLFCWVEEFLEQSERLSHIPHWTVTFNTCEKWGVHNTQPYVEVTPSNEHSLRRKNRNRMIIVERKNGDIEWLEDDELKNVDEQSGTPICLIDSETYKSLKYKHTIENLLEDIRYHCDEFIEKLKVSNMDNLRDLRDQLIDGVSLDRLKMIVTLENLISSKS